jgi:NAD(P)H-flavin reductase
VANRNHYLPRRAIVRKIVPQNALVRTFQISFEDEIYNTDFSYMPGQFMMLSMPHCGEAPFSFSSSPTRPGTFSLTIRRAGTLTDAVFKLREGDMIGIRGPYGRAFPMREIEGRSLLFIAGGIGMAPLHSALEYCIDRQEHYGRLTVLYGCKTPGEFCFRDDLRQWANQAGLVTRMTVDESCDEWNGCVGLVTSLLDDVEVEAEPTTAIVCGPGAMIRFVFSRLEAKGMDTANIITTLERHMKCGVGICGHCYFEEKMICTDGPVFNGSELANLEIL